MKNEPHDENEEKFVSTTKIRILPITILNVDPSYQRGVKKKHKNIVDEYDQTVLGHLLVGERRDGTFWVVDGLQRVTAMKKKGILYSPCEVFASEGPEHEAKIFTLAGSSKTRSNLTAADRYRAALAAKNPIALTVDQVVRKNGFEVSLNGVRGTEAKLKKLSCVSTLMGAVESMGSGDALDFSLGVIKEAWPADPQRNTILIIGALVKFYNLYSETGVPQTSGPLSRERLVPRLQDTSPIAIIQEARIGSTMYFSGDQFSKGCAVIERLYRRRKYGVG